MAEKSLVPIGSVDSSGTMWANPNALALAGGGNTGIFASQANSGGQAPVMMSQPVYVQSGGGGLSGIPWQAIKGAFLTVSGLFQRANLESLKDDVKDAEDEYKTAKTAVDNAAAIFAATPSFANQLAVNRAQAVLNEATRKVNDAQTALGEENARSALYTTVGGIGDLAQSLGGGAYPGFSGGGAPMMMAAPQQMIMAAPQQMMVAAPQPMAAQPMVYIQGQGWSPVVSGFLGGLGGGLLANAFTSDRK